MKHNKIVKQFFIDENEEYHVVKEQIQEYTNNSDLPNNREILKLNRIVENLKHYINVVDECKSLFTLESGDKNNIIIVGDKISKNKVCIKFEESLKGRKRDFLPPVYPEGLLCKLCNTPYSDDYKKNNEDEIAILNTLEPVETVYIYEEGKEPPSLFNFVIEEPLGELKCPNDKVDRVITVKLVYGTKKATIFYRKCPNRKCGYFNKGQQTYTPGKTQNSWGLLALAVKIYCEETRDYKRTAIVLRERFGIKLSDNSIRRWVLRWLNVWKEERKPAIKSRMEKNGGIVLHLDGYKPKQGEPGLWVAFDHLTGETLHTKILDSANEQAIKLFVDEILEMWDLPLLGVVSDAEVALFNAISRHWPDIPYQICLFHFFSNCLKSVNDMDSNIRKNLRTECRKLKTYLKHIKPSKSEEVNRIIKLLKQIFKHLEVIAKADYSGERELGGLDLYEQIKIATELMIEFAPLYNKQVLKVTSRFEELLIKYKKATDDLGYVNNQIRGVIRIINSDSPLNEVKTDLIRAVKNLKASKGRIKSKKLKDGIDWVCSRTEAKESHLFVHTTNELIPKTNNLAETRIGELQAFYREGHRGLKPGKRGLRDGGIFFFKPAITNIDQVANILKAGYNQDFLRKIQLEQKEFDRFRNVVCSLAKAKKGLFNCCIELGQC